MSFNATDYVKEWTKENMKSINLKYKREFVEEFNKACEEFGIVKSQFFKECMQDLIDKYKSNKK